MAKKSKVTVDLPTRHVELEKCLAISGTLYNSAVPRAEHVLFVPDDPKERENMKYIGSGRLQSMSDGTCEWVRSTRKQSQAEQLLRTTHGTLSKTADGYYLAQIRIPINGENKYSEIIKNELQEIAEILE